METLLGHWDSSSGNANNFYIYRSPVDGLLHFIPWGADASFTGIHLFKPDSGPLYRNFKLADRLYNIDSFRLQYLNTLSAYLENLWDEQLLQTELENIAQLTTTSESAYELINLFIHGRGEEGDSDYIPSQRRLLERAIAGETLSGNAQPLADVPLNCTQPVTSNLTANITSNNVLDIGTFGFTLLSGQVVNASLSVASVAVDSLIISQQTTTSPAVMSLLITGADINDEFKPYVLQVFIELPSYVEGTHQFHGFATNLILFDVDQSEPLGVATLALGETGSIVINSLGDDISAGDIVFSIDANIEFQAEEGQANEVQANKVQAER